MQVEVTATPETAATMTTCYACKRHFHEDDLGLCLTCGSYLCMLPSCPDKCKCEEEEA
jgi:hypothetical protein